MLKEDAGSASSGFRKARLASGLVVTQISLSLLLLICARLFIRSFMSVQQINPGFNSHNVLIASYDLFTGGYSRPSLRINSSPGGSDCVSMVFPSKKNSPLEIIRRPFIFAIRTAIRSNSPLRRSGPSGILEVPFAVMSVWDSLRFGFFASFTTGPADRCSFFLPPPTAIARMASGTTTKPFPANAPQTNDVA